MSDEENPPIIGISGSKGTSDSVQRMVKQIREAGGIPLFLGNHAMRDAQADLDKIDALIVLGNNNDLDPAKYGQEKHPKTIPENDTHEGAARALYEENLLQHALDSGMPVLGVCGGMQRINVMLGGSLHQHVPDLVGNEHHDQTKGPDMYPAAIPVHPVLIENDSTLGGIAEEIKAVYVPDHSAGMPSLFFENSMHHQAVDRVGKGLRAAAYADDDLPGGGKLVEAIEADPHGKYGKQFLMGVQWHPEYGDSPLSVKLADHIISEGLAFAKKHKRAHPMMEAVEENKRSGLEVAAKRPAQTAIAIG